MSIRITRGFVKTQIAGPTPRFLIQKAWGGADDLFAFLTGPLGDAASCWSGDNTWRTKDYLRPGKDKQTPMFPIDCVCIADSIAQVLLRDCRGLMI